MENAKDEEDVTKRGEKNKAEHEDPIVELKDMPGPAVTIQKTRGKGKHVLKKRKKVDQQKKLEQAKET